MSMRSLMPRNRASSGSRSVIGVAARSVAHDIAIEGQVTRRTRQSVTGDCRSPTRRPLKRAPVVCGRGRDRSRASRPQATRRLVHAAPPRRHDRRRARHRGVRRVTRATGRPLAVLDPACGDGRFLAAVDRIVRRFGGEHRPRRRGTRCGCRRTTAAGVLPAARIITEDALERTWSRGAVRPGHRQPAVPLAARSATTRGGAGARGGGPYADQAVQFLALGAELVDPSGGRLGLVLPQSVLSSRDAAGVRRAVDDTGDDDLVVVDGRAGLRCAGPHLCVVGFEFGTG